MSVAEDLVTILDAVASETRKDNSTDKMKLKYHKASEANARAWAIEKELGLPKSDAVYHIRAANQKVGTLELLLAAKSSGAAGGNLKAPCPAQTVSVPSAAPVSSTPGPVGKAFAGVFTPAASAPAPAVPSAPARPTINQLRDIARDVGLGGNPTADQLWPELERHLYLNRLTVPGMRSDAEMAKTFTRLPDHRFVGTQRYERDLRQKTINKILNPPKPKK